MITRLRRAANGWVEDQAGQMGAALAYYALFSLAPLLILGISLIGLAYGHEEARRRVVEQVERHSDPQSAEAVSALLDSFGGGRGLTGASAVGLVTLVFGAAGLFTSLRASLHRIWRIQTPQDGLVRGLVKTYAVALSMVLVSCVFLLMLMVVSALLPLLAPRIAERFPAFPYTGPVVDFAGSTLLLTLLFAVTFRVLSDRRLSYRQVSGGALVTAVLFAVGKIGLGYYFRFVNVASGYGAAGSLVVILAWVYYSAQIVYFGAEVVRFGLPGGRAPEGADRGATPAASSGR
jgi:membrane protein